MQPNGPGRPDDRVPARARVDHDDAGGEMAAGPDVYWFVGGPLDGRVHTRPAAEPAPATVRYVHLHEGPQIVHHYDLHEVAGHGGEYRLRAD